MKLLRIGSSGKEKPVVLDKDNKFELLFFKVFFSGLPRWLIKVIVFERSLIKDTTLDDLSILKLSSTLPSSIGTFKSALINTLPNCCNPILLSNHDEILPR